MANIMGVDIKDRCYVCGCAMEWREPDWDGGEDGEILYRCLNDDCVMADCWEAGIYSA